MLQHSWLSPPAQIVVHGLPYSFSWQDLKGERRMLLVPCRCSTGRHQGSRPPHSTMLLHGSQRLMLGLFSSSAALRQLSHPAKQVDANTSL